MPSLTYSPSLDPSLLTPPPPSPLLSSTLDSDLTTLSTDPTLLAALSSPKSTSLEQNEKKVEEELARCEGEAVEMYLGKGEEIGRLQGELRGCDGILAGLQVRRKSSS